MKYLGLILVLLSSLEAFAARDRGQLLKCLGEEEKKFHLKKSTGPLYDLNQKLIGEMIQIPNADISPNFLGTICQNKKISPSWKLLELSISKGRTIFIMPGDIGGMQKEMTLGMIDDYVESTKEILLGFINQVQSLSPTPTCLGDEIPELNKFFIDIKYLQEDVEMAKIFEGRDLRIFERLEEYPEAFQRCRERERLKKKTSPSSKEEPKKT